MTNIEGSEQRSVQPEEENINPDANVQLILDNIYPRVPIETNDEEPLVSFGDARPVEHLPSHLQAQGPVPLDDAMDDPSPNGDRLGVQPMEIEMDNNHPYDQGGLDEDTIHELIRDNDEIEFSSTVMMAHVEHRDDNDDVELSTQTQEEPMPDEPIAITINEVLAENPTPTDGETPVAVTMDQNETDVVITNHTQTQLVIIIEPADNEPAAEALPTVPPIIEQIPTSRASSNEVRDERVTTIEPEPTNGAMNLPVHLHGHHRSKSADAKQMNSFGQSTVIGRPRSHSFML